MKPFLLLITLMIALGCSDKPKPNNTISTNPSTGVYVNTRTSTDTIDFDRFKDSPTFDLRRGMDSTTSTPKPKSKTGYYRFTVSDNKIKVDWMFASKRDTTQYVFRMKGDSLMIGNFWEEERAGEVEVFVRSH